jgi:hypothetical protein
MLHTPPNQTNASGSHKTFLKERVSHLVFYLDTVELLLSKRPDPDAVKEWLKHCHGKSLPYAIPSRYKGRNGKWVIRHWKVTLTQPTPEAIEAIREWKLKHLAEVRFWRIDFAADHVTAHPGDVREVRDFYRQHATVKGNRSKVKIFPNTETGHETDYIGNVKKHGGYSVAWYCDRIKFEQIPFHLEIRTYRHAYIAKRLGIESLMDLLTFDVRQYVLGKITFNEINRTKLNRKTRGRVWARTMQQLVNTVKRSPTYLTAFNPELETLKFRTWNEGVEDEWGQFKKSLSSSAKVCGDFEDAQVNHCKAGGHNRRQGPRVNRPRRYLQRFKPRSTQRRQAV